MRLGADSWFAIGCVTFALVGCQGSPQRQSEGATTPATAPAVAVDTRAGNAPPIAWAGAGDCLGQLRLLRAAAAQRRLDESHEPPFAVVAVAPTTSLEWIEAPTVPVVADLPLKSYEDRSAASAAAPCLLLVEPARDLRAAHSVVDFEDVASEYQSGVRSERNPDYDAAQARVRDAERDGNRRGPGVLRVGDPMLDLVGLLVGGVIATFGDLGGDDVDDALAALKETPRSRDRPVYRAYEFERSTVRAGKEAIIPVALRDLRRGRIWRTELRQREMRQFAVLEGLDPRDRDYDQHRAGALSWREFEHWQRQPPTLPLSALVAALVEADGPAAAPQKEPELVADASSDLAATGPADADQVVTTAALPSALALAPMAGPDAGATGLGPDRRAAERMPLPAASAVRASPEAGASRQPGPLTEAAVAATIDPRVASVVRLHAGDHRGNGLYVRPRLIVTSADVIGSASVVDVTTSDGKEVLGLVVLADPTRNLAAVYVPRAGPVAPFADARALGRMLEVVELAGDGRARVLSAGLEAAAGHLAPTARLELQDGGADAVAGAPVFLEDRAIGLVGTARNLIGIDAVADLLESEALAALQ
jgi:hypothetical protein